jgi:hypothetical protein
MKKFILGLIMGSLIFSVVGVFAASYVADVAGFKVLVNGKEFVSDPPALVVEGRTYLPLRAMGDALGVPVNWNAELGQAEVGVIPRVDEGTGIIDDKYYIEVLSARKSKDYSGKDVVIINYRYTNNSDETQSFMFAFNTQAFQNNVELENAIVINDKSYNSENALKDIKPGGNIEVQQAYILQDNSPVTVEVGPLFSFDDDTVISKTFTLQ